MIFIAGPRQVGKTTLAKFLLEQTSSASSYFNWDIESHRKKILKDPEGFWRSREDRPGKPRIALDEIHKYPRWKRFLKGFYDAVSQEAEILVTGSGRLDVYQRGGDSLLGRYNLFRLHPFTVSEIVHSDRESVKPPTDFENQLLSTPSALNDAEKALQDLENFSGFPEPLFSGSSERLRRWRRTRHQLVLREDLRDLTRIRELGLIEALVTLIPERVGSPLSLNALREDLGVAFGTVQAWIQTLERLYFLFELRPFTGKLARSLRRESKVYLFDGTEIENPGARFENLVALHLLKACDAWNDLGYGDFGLHYVRDKEKREVDFLMTENRRPYLLVETKHSDQALSPALNYFHQRLKPKYSIQLVRQSSPNALLKQRSGIFVMAAPRFLALLA